MICLLVIEMQALQLGVSTAARSLDVSRLLSAARK